MTKPTLNKMSKCQADTPNLYLVGFMGTGKSTIGRRAAEALGMHFIDSDHAIENASGMPIPDIFKAHGEPHFRELERAFVQSGHPETGAVVSCGGGLVVQPGILEMLEGKGIVVCLFASIETILARVSGNQNRPLLEVDDQEKRIRTLLAEREPIYRRVNTQIMTDHRPIGSVVQHLTRTYVHEARRFQSA